MRSTNEIGPGMFVEELVEVDLPSPPPQMHHLPLLKARKGEDVVPVRVELGESRSIADLTNLELTCGVER